MFKKYLLFVISILVVLQSAIGRPNTEETSTTFTGAQNRKRNTLFDYTGGQYYLTIYGYLYKIKTIFDSVVNDSNLQLSKAEIDELNRHKNLIETNAREAEQKCSVDLKADYKLRQEVLEILPKYDSLKPHGLTQLETDFNTKLTAFFDKFQNRADEFWNGLTAEERRAEHKFKNWWDQFVAEQDAEKKFHMFLTLFELHDFRYAVRCI